MKQWLLYACTLVLLAGCGKHDENGRFRADYIGVYPCQVNLTKHWGNVNSPDSITQSNGLDTVKVYFGEAADEIIVMEHTLPINTAGEYSGDHPVSDPAGFSLLFSGGDSLTINYEVSVSGATEFWRFRGARN